MGLVPRTQPIQTGSIVIIGGILHFINYQFCRGISGCFFASGTGTAALRVCSSRMRPQGSECGRSALRGWTRAGERAPGERDEGEESLLLMAAGMPTLRTPRSVGHPLFMATPTFRRSWANQPKCEQRLRCREFRRAFVGCCLRGNLLNAGNASDMEGACNSLLTTIVFHLDRNTRYRHNHPLV